MKENLCEGCSENCCTKFFIILEEVKDKDWIRWLSYHQGVTIKDLGKNRIEVWFDLPCEHLTQEKKCAIYPKRPKICRKFLCPKMEKK